MASVLIVDDNRVFAKNQQKALEDAGHTVTCVTRDYIGQFHTELLRLLAEQYWDVFVLDISLMTERFGGIWLYNKLAGGGHRERWNHTIIYTKLAGTEIASATEGDQLVLRVFVDTSGIPFDCVMNNQVGGRQSLIDKIAELTQGG